MRSLKRDPAPSRLAFRLRRMWRSPGVRRAAKLWAPLALVACGLAYAASQAEIRDRAVLEYEAARAALTERPEFAVRRIEVRGATPHVAAQVEAAASIWRGASSLAIKAEEIRTAVAALGWVESARVRLDAPETLVVTVKERRPSALWRRGGALALIDADGAEIADVDAREDWPDLPVLAGAGADRAVEEALDVIAAAGPLGPRLRGLVRVGERRWDAVLSDGPLVMLPAKGAADSMAYLAALQGAEKVADKDVSRIDLRLAARRTLRLNTDAADALAAERAPKKKTPGEDA